MLKKISQVEDLEIIFNILDNIDAEKYLTDNHPLLYLLDKKCPLTVIF